MRVTPLQRHVALAIAIGLTFWAAAAEAVVSLERQAGQERAAHALTLYRDEVREIFADLYDDVQPMEDAFDLASRHASPDPFPARDLLASKQVLAGITDAQHRLTQLHPPADLAASSRDLSSKLDGLATAVKMFPPLDRNYFVAELTGAAAAMETTLYELSVPLARLLGGARTPLPGHGASATKRPRSRGSYIVASAHICGPADREISKLPEFKEVTDPGALPTIRRTATVMTRVLDQLTALPRPRDDTRKLDRDVVTPLSQEPSLATALSDLATALEEHDDDGLADVGDEFDAAATAAEGAADALESYGALACADLLAYFLDEESDVLSA